jgi:hypothetical protein
MAVEGIDPSILLEPFAELIQPIVGQLSVIIGGVFGLYLILILIRIYYERKKVSLLKRIHDDMHYLRMQTVGELPKKQSLLHRTLARLAPYRFQPKEVPFEEKKKRKRSTKSTVHKKRK